MTVSCLSLCIHLSFVVDRIEPPWAIAEWEHVPTLGDIHIHRFPTRPREGSKWVVHIPLGLSDPPAPAFITRSPTTTGSKMP